MTTVVASREFVRRALPIIIAEGVLAASCVIGFVVTGSWMWIASLVVVSFLGGLAVVILLFKHRDEWRAGGGRPRSAMSGEGEAR